MAKKPKEMIALRLDPIDRRKIKAFSGRLAVTESDLIRYAIKRVLAELSPLGDQTLEGAELLPAFLGHGPEMTRWLDLSEDKLDTVLHRDLENESLRVSKEDLRMVLTNGQTTGYVNWWAAIIQGKKKPRTEIFTPQVYLDEKYVAPVRDEKWVAEELERRGG